MPSAPGQRHLLQPGRSGHSKVAGIQLEGGYSAINNRVVSIYSIIYDSASSIPFVTCKVTDNRLSCHLMTHTCH